MKKSLLALAVAAAAVAATSAASAATVYDKDGTSLAVYGRMQAVVYSGHASNKTGNSYQDSGLQGSGRLGFDMRTQLTDGIAAFAKAEWDVADNGERDGSGKGNNDSFNSRYLWVGADFGQFGQVKFGRFEDSVKYVLLPTDVGYADDFDCQSQMDNDDKRDGNIMYTWNGYGFTFNANFETAKDSQQVDGAWFGVSGEKLDIDNAYGVSVGYQSPDVLFGPIGIRLGYAGAQFQDEAKTDGTTNGTALYDKYNQYAVSLYWGNLNAANGPFVAAMYQVRDFTMTDAGVAAGYDDYKVQGAEFVVGYGFDCGVSAIVGYNWMNIDQDGAQGVDVDASVIPVAVNYQITPNFQVWAEARFDAGTDDDNAVNGVKRNFDEVAGTYNTENVYSLGARYTF